MEIIVPDGIKKRELGGSVSDEAKKVFEKVKESPGLAKGIAAKGLPASTTLHKFYATTPAGARRLLFFCRHESKNSKAPERWVLLFYRDKGDSVGDNMSSKNPAFVSQLEKNLGSALTDLTLSTAQIPRYEKF